MIFLIASEVLTVKKKLPNLKLGKYDKFHFPLMLLFFMSSMDLLLVDDRAIHHNHLDLGSSELGQRYVSNKFKKHFYKFTGKISKVDALNVQAYSPCYNDSIDI